MKRRRALERKCPLTRSRKTGLSRRALSQREVRERADVVAAVFARDHFTCRFTHPGFGPCWGPLTPHHVKKASQGGRYVESNLVAACSFHNDLVESDADAAALAVRCGLVVRRSA